VEGDGEPAPFERLQPLRQRFRDDLEQLRLQVEVMALRVADAISGAHCILETGDTALAARVVASDDDVDAMCVSLTEKCYDLIGRETPVASDLRLVVSVIRIIEELERVGDLALRVVKAVDDHAMLTAHPPIQRTLVAMAEVADESFAIALTAWSTRSFERTNELLARDELIDSHYSVLTRQLLALRGSDAPGVAIHAVLIGRALERISDHAVVIGERVGYLLTGDPRYLASEVRLP
jgi:phosphate transport system protein